MPSAYATFDDQRLGYGCTYTLSLGTAPGVARISAPIDAGRVNSVGVLDIFLEGRRFLRLHDARLDNPSSPSSTTSVPTIEWSIEDRRWKWEFGYGLEGDYNVPQEDGTLLRERSPRQLADECFEALGEDNVDVSALPRDPRPRIKWRDSSPREELDRICADFGCAPAFNPFTNKAYVVKLGKGTAPPNRPHKSRTDATVSRPRPDSIRIVGGNTLFQSALEIEPVMPEISGEFVPADSVSYKPPSGWGSIMVAGNIVSGFNTTYTDPATGQTLYHRDLALKHLWRTFRIKGQRAGGFSPDSLKGQRGEPTAITDLGPFTGTVLEKDPLTGERLPAFVRGEFADSRFNFRNSPAKTKFHGTVSINSELRLVTLSETVFKKDSNGKPTAPSLDLIAAYEVTSEGVPIHYEKSRAVQGKSYSAGEHREYRDEIVREIIEKTASAAGAKVDNLKDIDKQANHYLDELKDQYVDRPAANITYSGLFNHVCDGKLRSVTWSFSTTSTPSTSCAWDCSFNKIVHLWEDRPAYRVQKQADAAIRRAKLQAAVAASQAGVLKGGA